jgi:hypothetical protein
VPKLRLPLSQQIDSYQAQFPHLASEIGNDCTPYTFVLRRRVPAVPQGQRKGGFWPKSATSAGGKPPFEVVMAPQLIRNRQISELRVGPRNALIERPKLIFFCFITASLGRTVIIFGGNLEST